MDDVYEDVQYAIDRQITTQLMRVSNGDIRGLSDAVMAAAMQLMGTTKKITGNVINWLDDREKAGVNGGHGVAFAANTRIDQWRPFLRAGFADGGGTFLDRAISVGTGYDARGGQDLAGLGLSWGRTSGSSRDQYTMEAFYRFAINGFFQVSPEIQYVANPANDPATDDILVFGLRLRVAF